MMGRWWLFLNDQFANFTSQFNSERNSNFGPELEQVYLFIYYNIYKPRNFNYLNQRRRVAGGRK